ncbi:MAG: transposase [Desulfobacterales bacterium]|nr:transposase [Desulfobacterales bacterium]
MQPLDKSLRNKLEKTIKEARDTAEDAALAALEPLGVAEPTAYVHLTEVQRQLRRKLRVHGRQIGDCLNGGRLRTLDRLIEEVAYEHWHRMLFARFLAENNLLMFPDPDAPVAVSIEECEDLAAEEGVKNGWELASRFAARMLPEIFRPESPVFLLELPPEYQQKLERLLAELPREVFHAADSLGWVYQFWQAKKKDEVNAAEVKIGARELPAVTQLFTEPYMVAFLLDNSLGAWWAARRLTEDDLRNAKTEEELRHKIALPGMPLDYLRFVKVETASSRLNMIDNSPKVEAASSRLKEFGYFHKDDDIINLSGNLPHWRQEGVTYFVTFRTADSLPQAKLRQWLEEKEAWLKQHPEPHNEATRKEFYELFPERLQLWLDQSYGECLLAQTKIKSTVETALKHFDGERYDVDEFVVMPNHVHVVVTPKSGHQLSDILHSWKSFTSNAINKETGKTGSFWQKESFDHIVRSSAQLEKIRFYIKAHPAHELNSRRCFQPLDSKRQDAASTIWKPAAGVFDGWPQKPAEFKMLDPCCGSGHFLVVAFSMLTAMRMADERVSVQEAADAVLRDNLHGLEIDRRCTEIAAFNLALAAWRHTGYRPLPALHLACTGLCVGGTRAQWMEILAGQAVVTNLRFYFGQLYDLFSKAPILGSLINPHRFLGSGLLDDKAMANLHRALAAALAGEEKFLTERSEMGVTAQGVAKAAQLLAGRYTLVATNVPYLGRGKQDEALKEHLQIHYPLGKADLATAFVLRCLEFCAKGGSTALVTPQNWLFLTTYTKLRQMLLENRSWNVLARLGPKGFQTPMWDFNIQLGIFSAVSPMEGHTMAGIDVSAAKEPAEKAAMLRGDQPAEIVMVEQEDQLKNPDAKVQFNMTIAEDLLSNYAKVHYGSKPGQTTRVKLPFWEVPEVPNEHWQLMESTPENRHVYTGKSWVCLQIDQIRKQDIREFGVRGSDAWNTYGVLLSQMSSLPCSIYTGKIFDNNTSVIRPKDKSYLTAVWAFMSSEDFPLKVREGNQKLDVDTSSMINVPFDLAHWQKVAAEKYPNGLPEPDSDDPTQWLFHGRPEHSTAPLQVAVARLLGYRWPAESRSGILPIETDLKRHLAASESSRGFQPLDSKRQDAASTVELDPKMRLSQRARELARHCDELLTFADKDGIVCIPPVRGEASAADRLLSLLAAAYESSRGFQPLDLKRQDAASTSTFQAWLNQLLISAGFAGKHLETWLRDGFFSQHCDLFQQRPFIWQIWDGLRDGFSALVNYHKLGRKNLETLIYTYLGDWIKRQKDDIASGVDGARERLDAAETLKKRLELILEGETPHDIFVRWKPLHKQSMGWEPDLNDGVRLNIRPFLTVPDVKTKDAGVLRVKPKIKWTKDRGKEPKRPIRDYPWFWGWDGKVDFAGNSEFAGERFNDCHYTLDFKRRSRQSAVDKEGVFS